MISFPVPTFPPKPNARTPMGEYAFISDDGKYRLIHVPGSGYWAHVRRAKAAPWQWIPGVFQTTTSAARACGRTLASPPRSRWLKSQIHEDVL